MIWNKWTKLSAAGFAAAIGVVVVFSTVGAHTGGQIQASQGSLSVVGGFVKASEAATADEDATQDAAELAAELQKEAAEQAREAAQEAAEQAAEAAEDQDEDQGEVEEVEGPNHDTTDTESD